MAKIYGLFGSMQGKVADVVMAVRNGEQIVRKYQPLVSNPSTPAQVASRAKLKLLSQLSAAMGTVIAIPRQGIVTPRNLFTKYNYPAVTYQDSSDPATASINLSQVKITRSVLSLPELQVTNEQQNYTVRLGNTTDGVERVVYAIFAVEADNTLRLYQTAVVSTGPRFEYQTTLDTTLKYVAYAYGVRLNSDAARARFDQMQVASATLVASLITSRQLTEKDVTLTETKFVQMNS